MNNAPQTQLEAYKDLTDTGRDVLQREKVFAAYVKLGCATRKQVASHLAMPINVISGRTTELIQDKLLVISKEEKDGGRTPVQWLRPASPGEIIFDKPLTKIQQIERECKRSECELSKVILEIIKK